MPDAFCVARAEKALRIKVTANPLRIGFYGKPGSVQLPETLARFGPALAMSYAL